MTDPFTRKPSLKVRGMRWMISLLRPVAIPTEFILHSDLGERYLGFSSLLAVGILLFYCNSVLMIVIASCFVLRVVVHQAVWELRRESDAPKLHTRHAGVPFWGLLCNKMPEKNAQRWETSALLALAWLVAFFNLTAAGYLVASTMAGVLIRQLRGTIERNIVLDVVDELLEKEELNRKIEEHLGAGWTGARPADVLAPKVIELLAPATRRALPAIARLNGEIATSAD